MILAALARGDRFILTRIYQPIANLSIRRWHRSPYWLAGQCAIVGTVGFLRVCCEGLIGAAEPASRLLWSFLLLCWIGFGRSLWNEAMRYERRGLHRDPARSRDAVWARLWVFFLLMDILLAAAEAPTGITLDRWCSLATDFAIMSYGYFMDCSPVAPRRRQKARSPGLATVPSHG